MMTDDEDGAGGVHANPNSIVAQYQTTRIRNLYITTTTYKRFSSSLYTLFVL
jgi:hypothetical protein